MPLGEGEIGEIVRAAGAAVVAAAASGVAAAGAAVVAAGVGSLAVAWTACIGLLIPSDILAVSSG